MNRNQDSKTWVYSLYSLTLSSLRDSHPPNFLLNKTPKSVAKVPAVDIETLNTRNGREKVQKIGAWETREGMKERVGSRGQSWAAKGGNEPIWGGTPPDYCRPHSPDPRKPHGLFCSPLPIPKGLTGPAPSPLAPPPAPSSLPASPAALCWAG
jgi:hypothetical protein